MSKEQKVTTPRKKKDSTTKPRKTTTKTVPNQLTFEKIVENDKQYDETVDIELPNGEIVQIYVKFRPSWIEDMLLQFSDTLIALEEKGETITESFVQTLFGLHIIKSFTKFGRELPNDRETNIKFIHYMKDYEYLQELLDAFLKEEKQKAFDAMVNKVKQYADMIEQNKKLKKEFKEKIKGMNLQFGDVIMDMYGLNDEDNQDASV